MDKNIKDYLYLYLGCEGRLGSSHIDFTLVMVKTDPFLSIVIRNGDEYSKGQFVQPENFKPILRSISDITIDEAKEFFSFKSHYEIYEKHVSDHVVFNYRWKDERMKSNTKNGLCYSSVGIPLAGWQMELNSEKFLFLLSKHFDLFGLIDAGLAIDKTKISNNG